MFYLFIYYMEIGFDDVAYDWFQSSRLKCVAIETAQDFGTFISTCYAVGVCSCAKRCHTRISPGVCSFHLFNKLQLLHVAFLSTMTLYTPFLILCSLLLNLCFIVSEVALNKLMLVLNADRSKVLFFFFHFVY